jgi:YD repeat-containing protein
LGRLTKVVKDSSLYANGVTTKYQYDNLGNISQITDAQGKTTSYEYDGLKRLIKVSYPGGAEACISYDDSTNTTTVTNEVGGVVSEQKDWADRLILAKQYCTYDGFTDIYKWQFTYDSLGNRLRQVDSQSNQTDQEYDALGNLLTVKMPTVPVILPGATTVTDYQPFVNNEYNSAGFKTGTISANENAKGTKQQTNYTYDQLGRVIITTARAQDVLNGQTAMLISKVYYDAAGNKVKTVDGNGGVCKYTYSAKGWLLTETDQAGNTTRYQYDALGNKTAVTDPRGNGVDGTFTTWYKYDDLNRLVKTILPDTTPSDLSDNPATEVTYDEVGNKLTEKDPKGVVTSYTYTARNWVETVSLNGQLKTKYVYDAKGNQTEIHDALGNVTKKVYDSLGRVVKVTAEGTNAISETYTYDEVGNKLTVIDGRGNTTKYKYNSLGRVTQTTDPLGQKTQSFYDPNGNIVKVITPNNLVLQNNYDELNRLVEQLDSLSQATKSNYDAAGNRKQVIDRRGTTWVYQYYPDNLLKRLDLTGTDGSSYYVEYTYDAAGNRMKTTDSGNTVLYNYHDGSYQADPLNRINTINRTFDGATYQTAYRYDQAGLLTGIKYPEATKWLNYNYNELNQLSEVEGFTANQGITYDANGALKTLTFANGVVASYNYDNLNRLADYHVSLNGANLLQQQYTYDKSNNITAITEGDKTKTYNYDANNQLTRSITPGEFIEPNATAGTYGIKIGDQLGSTAVNFATTTTAMMGLDYNSSSIGIDFGLTVKAVKQIKVIPDKAYRTHRIVERTLDLYTSSDNITYTTIPKAKWTFAKDDKGVITITLKDRTAARYLKVHVKFDDRDTKFKAKDKATFLNDFAKMLRVYQEATSRTEEFAYDADGNRTMQRITLVQTNSYTSAYYTNSDQLKTDGKYAFTYDAAGNMVEKGNTFAIDGDTVAFTTSGDDVEYWQYKYDLLNRLLAVTKNGTLVAEYAYDPDGLRVVKKAKGVTTHYVFEGTEPIFEKKIATGKIKS